MMRKEFIQLPHEQLSVATVPAGVRTPLVISTLYSWVCSEGGGSNKTVN